MHTTFSVASHAHEQTLTCDNFYLSHKNWRASFSANEFVTSNSGKFSYVHGQIKLVRVDAALSWRCSVNYHSDQYPINKPLALVDLASSFVKRIKDSLWT